MELMKSWAALATVAVLLALAGCGRGGETTPASGAEVISDAEEDRIIELCVDLSGGNRAECLGFAADVIDAAEANGCGYEATVDLARVRLERFSTNGQRSGRAEVLKRCNP